VADKDIVLNGHTFADKGVAGDFAVLADDGVFLNLYKSPNLGIGADVATIEIDEFGQLDVFAKKNVIRHALECHRYTSFPLFFSETLVASSILTMR